MSSNSKNFLQLIVSIPALPFLWVGLYIGLAITFTLSLAALQIEFGEEIGSTVLTAIVIVATLALLMSIAIEIKKGGLEAPFASLKKIGMFVLASIALPILWFALSFLASIIMAIFFGLLTLVTPLSFDVLKENSEWLMSGSIILGAGATFKLVAATWKKNEDGLLAAILGSFALLLSLSF